MLRQCITTRHLIRKSISIWLGLLIQVWMMQRRHWENEFLPIRIFPFTNGQLCQRISMNQLAPFRLLAWMKRQKRWKSDTALAESGDIRVSHPKRSKQSLISCSMRLKPIGLRQGMMSIILIPDLLWRSAGCSMEVLWEVLPSITSCFAMWVTMQCWDQIGNQELGIHFWYGTVGISFEVWCN